MTHYLRFVTLAMRNALWEISHSAATVGLCFKSYLAPTLQMESAHLDLNVNAQKLSLEL